jgi:anti-anti-sigma factor
MDGTTGRGERAVCLRVTKDRQGRAGTLIFNDPHRPNGSLFRGAKAPRRGKLMITPAGIFEIETAGPTVIVTPRTDLDELEYQEIEAGAAEILSLLQQPPVKNIIFDFHRTDTYGSTALGFFVKVWKRLRSGHGQMAFCNVSDHEMEILRITKLDHVWRICSSREEALQALET